MRAHLLVLGLLVLPVTSNASTSSGWVGLEREASDGRTPWSIQLQRLDGDRVRVEMTLDGFHRVAVDRDDSRFEEILLPGTGTTRVPGLPALPVLRQRLIGSADQ